jgi:hypothetical protein
MEKLCVPMFVNNGACPAGSEVHLVYSKMSRISSMVENSIFIVASYGDYFNVLFNQNRKSFMTIT